MSTNKPNIRMDIRDIPHWNRVAAYLDKECGCGKWTVVSPSTGRKIAIRKLFARKTIRDTTYNIFSMYGSQNPFNGLKHLIEVRFILPEGTTPEEVETIKTVAHLM